MEYTSVREKPYNNFYSHYSKTIFFHVFPNEGKSMPGKMKMVKKIPSLWGNKSLSEQQPEYRKIHPYCSLENFIRMVVGT